MTPSSRKLINDQVDTSCLNQGVNNNLGIDYQQQVDKSSTESRLCQDKFYEECPSCAITDAVFTAGVKGMDFWIVNETSLTGSKDFSAGRVELQIRDRFDLTDFAEITYQAKEVIATQFGEPTLKLHYALAAIAFRQPDAWNQKIKVSVSKLLTDFGEDSKKRQYIPKAERNKGEPPTRYLPKEEKLRQLAHHCYLLKRLEVWVREWRVRSKGIFTVERSNLWDIFGITEVIQKELYGNDTLIDIEITFRPGLWFEKFAGNDYLREFGYLTSEALKLDPYREKMALRLAYFALFALQQHKNGRYQIVTLLKRIGYEQEIEEAKTNRVTALHLKRSFDRATNTLGNFQYPYKFDYDPDVPEWVDPDKKIKKPQGWFEIWLQLHGTLSQPEVLPKRKPEPSKTETPTQTPVEAKQPPPPNKKSKSVKSNIKPSSSQPFGQRVREARLSKGESLRSMAKELNISPSRLSQIENDRYPHKLQPSLIAEILAYVGLKD
ncbi:Ferredoxin [Crocosphaera watsonii WH 0005]|uniref:Ferredoxin n=3 Tax=Crocosphaera watsonii TaxID=263511 RepID=T2IL74_CROWT|nr:helix-turn-helix domain-containing protein [Crocosphaera watsonii]CCQ53783.1 Ferredoxin [Crocosphaera watsonii WH 0005]